MLDFVAVGDVVVDTFIKLKDASVHCDVDKEHCTITMAFGEKIPFELSETIYAVGNSPNAAVAAARLGLSSALVTNLGDDEKGQRSRSVLEASGVATDYVKVHKDKKTNHHYVLWYEDDRTILVKHEPYDYHFPQDLKAPKWLYLSSLGPDTEAYHEEIMEYVRAHPDTKLAFQPGTFQMNLGVEKLKDIYKNAELFFCNVGEAEKILGVNTLGTEMLLKRVRELGPKIVVITDGPKGAYAYDGNEIIFEPPFPDEKPPLERTGAGDGFASTTTAALALGKDLRTALKWGAVNSAAVVQEIGAQRGLLTRTKLEAKLG